MPTPPQRIFRYRHSVSEISQEDDFQSLFGCSSGPDSYPEDRLLTGRIHPVVFKHGFGTYARYAGQFFYRFPEEIHRRTVCHIHRIKPLLLLCRITAIVIARPPVGVPGLGCRSAPAPEIRPCKQPALTFGIHDTTEYV